LFGLIPVVLQEIFLIEQEKTEQLRKANSGSFRSSIKKK
jgi:hypothetical protein